MFRRPATAGNASAKAEAAPGIGIEKVIVVRQSLISAPLTPPPLGLHRQRTLGVARISLCDPAPSARTIEATVDFLGSIAAENPRPLRFLRTAPSGPSSLNSPTDVRAVARKSARRSVAAFLTRAHPCLRIGRTAVAECMLVFFASWGSAAHERGERKPRCAVAGSGSRGDSPKTADTSHRAPE